MLWLKCSDVYIDVVILCTMVHGTMYDFNLKIHPWARVVARALARIPELGVQQYTYLG